MKFAAACLVALLGAPSAYAFKSQTDFLSKKEIAELLSSQSDNSDGDEARSTSMTPISDDLHLRIRSHLCQDDDEECLSSAETSIEAPLTTITRTTDVHKDRYAEGSDATTGLVFLESNEDIQFFHGDRKVTAEAGKLVVFDGGEEHYTEMPNGHQTKVLGPFALSGRKLSMVKAGKPPCWVVSSDETLTGDFECDCTGLDAAIQLMASVTLDMNGYTVSCSAGNPFDAIVQMTGAGVTLLNGKISGFGSSGGDCIDMESDHQTVSGVTITDCMADGIDVESGADYATITNSWIKEVVLDCISVSNADNVEIRDNRIEECDSNAIDVDSSSSQGTNIEGNYIAAIGDDCISLDGRDHHVIGNEITNCVDDGIEVTSSGDGSHEIRKNDISLIGDDGIQLNEDYLIVTDNKLTKIAGSGIWLRSRADDATISNNVIVGVGENGILIDSGSEKNLVTYNKIRLVEDDGIDVEGDYNSILHNKVDKTADELIDVEGEYNVVKGNMLTNTVGDNANGVTVEGNHNVLKDNYISGSTDDCLSITADNTTVVGNQMKWCGDDGIEASGSASDNVIKKNWAYACDIALDDDTGSEDCGSNTWKNNKGNSFMPDCAGEKDFHHVKKPWW